VGINLKFLILKHVYLIIKYKKKRLIENPLELMNLFGGRVFAYLRLLLSFIKNLKPFINKK